MTTPARFTIAGPDVEVADRMTALAKSWLVLDDDGTTFGWAPTEAEAAELARQLNRAAR